MFIALALLLTVPRRRSRPTFSDHRGVSRAWSTLTAHRAVAYCAPMLQVNGDRITTPAGEPVVLKGVGLGGWMNMENFITGYPATESLQRKALMRALGPEGYAHYFKRFLDVFFGEEDAAFLAGLGLNSVRLPVNYRHFEDD